MRDKNNFQETVDTPPSWFISKDSRMSVSCATYEDSCLILISPVFSFIFKDFICFQREGAGGREASDIDVPEKHWWGGGTWSTTGACALSGSLTPAPLVGWPALNPESHQPRFFFSSDPLSRVGGTNIKPHRVFFFFKKENHLGTACLSQISL